MAQAAAHRLAGAHPALCALNQEAAIDRGTRQYGATVIGAVAVAALPASGLAVFTLGQVLVGLLPEALVVDQVHIVGAAHRIGCKPAGGVAGDALDDRPVVSLHLDSQQVVVGVRTTFYRPLGMSGTVTARTHNAAMSGAHPVQSRVACGGVVKAVENRHYSWFGKHFVAGHYGGGFRVAGDEGLAQADSIRYPVAVLEVNHDPALARQVVVGVSRVTGSAAGFVSPGHSGLRAGRIIKIALIQRKRSNIIGGYTRGEIGANLGHGPVAVTAQYVGVVHGAAQAPGLLAWVTLVAVVFQSGDAFHLVADGPGKGVLDRCRNWRKQVSELAVMIVHHAGIGLMGKLVTPVGVASWRTRHWADLGQVQGRGIVAGLAHNWLLLRQGAVHQAAGGARAAVCRNAGVALVDNITAVG